MNYRGGGVAKGMLAPTLKLLGGLPPPPLPTPMYGEADTEEAEVSLNLLHSSCVAQMQHKRVILSFSPTPSLSLSAAVV